MQPIAIVHERSASKADRRVSKFHFRFVLVAGVMDSES